MATQYAVPANFLVGVAEEARRLTNTADQLTTDEMLEMLESVESTDALPDAENAAFGTGEVTAQYGIATPGETSMDTNTASRKMFGYKFTPVRDIVCQGFRVFGSVTSTYAYALILWDSGGNVIAKKSNVTGVSGEWSEHLLSEPVTLRAGETYVVSYYNSSSVKDTLKKSGTVMSAYFSSVSLVCASSYKFPNDDYTGSLWPAVDIFFTLAEEGNIPTEYKIQTDTMTDIADEVKRLADASGKVSPAQMITALQSVEPHTDPVLQDKTITENGTYTADEGYDGLGTVTVDVPGGLEFKCAAVGVIPEYDHGYATSVLTLDDMFTSAAVGELTE